MTNSATDDEALDYSSGRSDLSESDLGGELSGLGNIYLGLLLGGEGRIQGAPGLLASAGLRKAALRRWGSSLEGSVNSVFSVVCVKFSRASTWRIPK